MSWDLLLTGSSEARHNVMQPEGTRDSETPSVVSFLLEESSAQPPRSRCVVGLYPLLATAIDEQAMWGYSQCALDGGAFLVPGLYQRAARGKPRPHGTHATEALAAPTESLWVTALTACQTQ